MPGPRERIRRLVSGGLDWAVGARDLALAAVPRPRRVSATSDGACSHLPVVVLPGILENARYLRGLIGFLGSAGHRVIVIESLGHNLATLAVSVERAMHEITEAGVREAVIVAHSKGGLIGKAMLLDPRSVGLLRGMVAIATPFSGSLLWPRLQRSAAIRRSPLGLFEPEGRELIELGRRDAVNGRIVSLAPAHDQVVSAGSHLAGATNVTLSASGHFRAVRDPATWQVVHRYVHELP